MNKLTAYLNNLTNKIPIIGERITEELMRFIVIGSSSFIIAYVLNNGLIFILDSTINPETDFQRASLVWFSYISAFLVSFTFNFNFTRKWTFKITGPGLRRQLTKFFIINICNALAGAAFVTSLDLIGISPLISQPFFVAMQTLWTFVLYKKWVFS